jgi:hypothetical protein
VKVFTLLMRHAGNGRLYIQMPGARCQVHRRERAPRCTRGQRRRRLELQRAHGRASSSAALGGGLVKRGDSLRMADHTGALTKRCTVRRDLCARLVQLDAISFCSLVAELVIERNPLGGLARASSVQVQRDRLPFAARHRGEPQSQCYASYHSEEYQQKTFTNEFWELTDFRLGRTVISPSLPSRIWQRRPY